MENYGLVTKIVKDSILDGPGCRYVVFLKGCNLACPWCHNPETQSKKQEILTYPKFCIGCGKCVEVAPEGTPKDVFPVKIDNKKAEDYFVCVENCPTNALQFAGKKYSADQIISEMTKYQTIYTKTGGGLTISGGDPLCNYEFTRELVEKASKKNIHVALDTAGAYPWTLLKSLTPYVNLWLYDLKHINDENLATPRSIDNLLRLSKIEGVRIFIRIPIIPNYNDKEEVWEELAYFISKAKSGIEQVSLLPFHPYGQEKYYALHREFFFEDEEGLDGHILEQARKTFERTLPKKIVNIGRDMVHG